MPFNMYNFLNNLSFTRVSASEEELLAATMIKDTVEKLNGTASIIPFEVSAYQVKHAKLYTNNKEYEVSKVQ